MEHEYKVGDWVQIVDTSEIAKGINYWENGDIVQVRNVRIFGDLRVSSKHEVGTFPIFVSELHAIRPIGGKSKVTKYLGLTINEEKRTSSYEPMTIHGRDLIAEAERLANETYLQNAINHALDTGDRELFMQLTQKELTT